MVKVLLVLFMGMKPAGAIALPDIESCERLRVEVMADPTKPAEAKTACFVLREKA